MLRRSFLSLLGLVPLFGCLRPRRPLPFEVPFCVDVKDAHAAFGEVFSQISHLNNRPFYGWPAGTVQLINCEGWMYFVDGGHMTHVKGKLTFGRYESAPGLYKLVDFSALLGMS